MEKKLEQEINELNVLIDKGVEFSVAYKVMERKLFKTITKKRIKNIHDKRTYFSRIGLDFIGKRFICY